jgi:hypothetical protein
MKSALLVILSSFFFSLGALASGCFNESFYNLNAVTQAAGADACYFESLKKIADPQSPADRQYNYFAEKVNEYAMVFGPEALDSASFEFMFYPAIRKSALSNSDAGTIKFVYNQTFNCQKQGQAIPFSSKIHVFGKVGLTGVCISKTDMSF